MTHSFSPSTAPLEILIVEDNDSLRNDLVDYLAREDWHVRGVPDGAAMDAALRACAADIIVLDLNLPQEDGVAICQRLRATSMVGIVMLTARAHAADRAVGYGAGADIYLTKPANVGELESAIYNLSRRMRPLSEDTPYLNRLKLTISKHNGKSAKLSLNEYKMLSRLAVAPNHELPSEVLFHTMRPAEEDMTALSALDRQNLAVFMSRLRKNLGENLGEPELLKAVRNFGYRLSAPIRVHNSESDPEGWQDTQNLNHHSRGGYGGRD